MKLFITAHGEHSVFLVKRYANGREVVSYAIRYPHNGIIAYDNPFLFSQKDRNEVTKWFKNKDKAE
jgi:hypothetical protein